MILQALTRCYEELAARGKLQRPGWSEVAVSWALQLNTAGELVAVLPLEQQEMRGKKAVSVPQRMVLPAPQKRAVGIVSNYLWDNASYVLGTDNKGKPERSRQCFDAFRVLHQNRLSGVAHSAAKALLAFLSNWSPEDADAVPVLTPYLDEIRQSGNIVFLVEDVFAQDVPEIAEALQTQTDVPAQDSRVCLVTGRREPIARLHPSVKGVPGAQSSGASLVSFNAPAYESFGQDGGQGFNAPVSEYAAFAYAEALNWLIRDPDHHRTMGDTMVVYWAEGNADPLAWVFGGAIDGVTDEDAKAAIKALANGSSYRWDTIPLEPSNRFYVLGIAPNAARLSVRFFLADTFGAIAKNLTDHMARLKIVRPAFETQEALAFWQILRETVNPHSTDKKPSPTLSGDLPRAILMGLPYPTTLYQQIQLRIRAGEDVNWRKAALIKAYLLKNVVNEQQHHPYKEALQEMLNEDTRCTPYVLGRLFAVLEKLQIDAVNPTATIRDRYFNSACNMPYAVFPTLIKLSQAHLKKLNTGHFIRYDKLIQELLGKIDLTYPKRLSLEEQGVFQIGYYHQKQALYTKKEDTSHE